MTRTTDDAHTIVIYNDIRIMVNSYNADGIVIYKFTRLVLANYNDYQRVIYKYTRVMLTNRDLHKLVSERCGDPSSSLLHHL